MALLSVENLQIGAKGPGEKTVVDNVSFALEPGKVTALIGESGSGKTTIALSALGYTRPGLAFLGGEVRLDGKNLLAMPPDDLRRLRGAEVSYVAQSAAASFDPAMRLMDQIVEASVIHGRISADAARRRARELIELVRLPDPDRIGARYPHEVSGGQLQRLMLVMALCPRPKLLLLDEPTTALDVTTQISVLHSVRDAIREEETAAIYVSHDLAVVSQIADEAVVLYRGRVREAGTIAQIVSAPADRYTKRLIAAARHATNASEMVTPATDEAVISVRDLTAGYGKTRVVSNVSFSVGRGEIVALIGESGSGKSTLAKVMAGMVPAQSGMTALRGKALPRDMSGRTHEQKRAIQYVPQMADTALNPNQKIGTILSRPVTFFRRRSGAGVRARVAELIDQMALPASFLKRYPYALSGGQKQRVNLARALAADPDVLLCDEVTSALDALVAQRIVALMRQIRDDTGVSILFISHDIGLVSAISDRIVVLYGGRVVEAGTREEVLAPPFHPYTRLLLISSPELRVGWLEEAAQSQEALAGSQVAGPLTNTACPFFNRCPLAIPGTCDTQAPPRMQAGKTHELHCHRTRVDLSTRLGNSAQPDGAG